MQAQLCTTSPSPSAGVGRRRGWGRCERTRQSAHLALGHVAAAHAAAHQRHWPGWQRALPLRPRQCQAHAAHPDGGAGPVTTAPPSTPEGASGGPARREERWAALRLLKRQLDVAVSEEDYKLAAALRDEVKSQVASLPAVQQYLYGQVSVLRGGSLQERQQAIKAMVEAGDDVVVPDLAACLGDPELADLAYEAMWALFMRNPDPDINELMVRGVSLMHSPATREVALAVFDDMIRRAPSFAEGYNKRATVLYTMKRFEEAIEDCKRVLAMQPYHFGAASGMGLCYLMLSREPEAAEAFELALTIYPGMTDIANVLRELRKRLAASQPGPSASSSSSAAPGEQDGEGGQQTRPPGPPAEDDGPRQ